MPNLTFGSIAVKVLGSLKQRTDVVLDTHLMIAEPIRYIQKFAQAGADIITVHVEACQDISHTLREIRTVGCKTGLTLNPDTSLEQLDPWLSEIDVTMIMSVYSGFAGQAYIPDSSQRICQLRSMIDCHGSQVFLEVDGGVGIDNIGEIIDCGADVIVVGSAIFGGIVSERMYQLRHHAAPDSSTG